MICLYIDGEPVTISKIGREDRHGFQPVYINNFSSCHQIPAQLIRQGGTAKTGGHVYRITIKRG